MMHPEEGFVWRCNGCGTLQTTDGHYREDAKYQCSACKIKARVPKKCVKYEVKYDPFTFECPYCSTIQHTRDYDYKGNVDGYYVTETNCLDCGKHITFREPDYFHVQGFMFKCGCGHVTNVSSQYHEGKTYMCRHCKTMVRPEKDNIINNEGRRVI